MTAKDLLVDLERLGAGLVPSSASQARAGAAERMDVDGGVGAPGPAGGNTDALWRRARWLAAAGVLVSLAWVAHLGLRPAVPRIVSFSTSPADPSGPVPSKALG